MFSVTISSSIYLYLVFRKDLLVKVCKSDIKKLKPHKGLKEKREIIISLLILFSVILLIVFKDYIFGIT
jgi:hypothetical protein